MGWGGGGKWMESVSEFPQEQWGRGGILPIPQKFCPSSLAVTVALLLKKPPPPQDKFSPDFFFPWAIIEEWEVGETASHWREYRKNNKLQLAGLHNAPEP